MQPKPHTFIQAFRLDVVTLQFEKFTSIFPPSTANHLPSVFTLLHQDILLEILLNFCKYLILRNY